MTEKQLNLLMQCVWYRIKYLEAMERFTEADELAEARGALRRSTRTEPPKVIPNQVAKRRASKKKKAA